MEERGKFTHTDCDSPGFDLFGVGGVLVFGKRCTDPCCPTQVRGSWIELDMR
jgi:hypothetical protein